MTLKNNIFSHSLPNVTSWKNESQHNFTFCFKSNFASVKLFASFTGYSGSLKYRLGSVNRFLQAYILITHAHSFLLGVLHRNFCIYIPLFPEKHSRRKWNVKAKKTLYIYINTTFWLHDDNKSKQNRRNSSRSIFCFHYYLCFSFFSYIYKYYRRHRK